MDRPPGFAEKEIPKSDSDGETSDELTANPNHRNFVLESDDDSSSDSGEQEGPEHEDSDDEEEASEEDDVSHAEAGSAATSQAD